MQVRIPEREFWCQLHQELQDVSSSCRYGTTAICVICLSEFINFFFLLPHPLPPTASDVYYRDDIGNISTSALRVMDDTVELDLRPRFPLFGGWKTHYVIGYNVPSYEYLFRRGDNFALNMRLVDHVFDDMLVEEFRLKIILPEGAKV